MRNLLNFSLVSTIALIFLKLIGNLNCNWLITLLPIWLTTVIILLLIIIAIIMKIKGVHND